MSKKHNKNNNHCFVNHINKINKNANINNKFNANKKNYIKMLILNFSLKIISIIEYFDYVLNFGDEKNSNIFINEKLTSILLLRKKNSWEIDAI